MELGRDESKHISCLYDDCKNECPLKCDKCAIGIKTDGDISLVQNNIDQAIRNYKRAVFIDPTFAEAWCNLGNALGMKTEYHNAIIAFNKAINIDDKYGKALFGKAITLHKLGKNGDAIMLANDILDLYPNQDVSNFRNKLYELGARDIRVSRKMNEATTSGTQNIFTENDFTDAYSDSKTYTERKIDDNQDKEELTLEDYRNNKISSALSIAEKILTALHMQNEFSQEKNETVSSLTNDLLVYEMLFGKKLYLDPTPNFKEILDNMPNKMVSLTIYNSLLKDSFIGVRSGIIIGYVSDILDSEFKSLSKKIFDMTKNDLKFYLIDKINILLSKEISDNSAQAAQINKKTEHKSTMHEEADETLDRLTKSTAEYKGSLPKVKYEQQNECQKWFR